MTGYTSTRFSNCLPDGFCKLAGALRSIAQVLGSPHQIMEHGLGQPGKKLIICADQL